MTDQIDKVPLSTTPTVVYGAWLAGMFASSQPSTVGPSLTSS